MIQATEKFNKYNNKAKEEWELRYCDQRSHIYVHGVRGKEKPALTIYTLQYPPKFRFYYFHTYTHPEIYSLIHHVW